MPNLLIYIIMQLFGFYRRILLFILPIYSMKGEILMDLTMKEQLILLSLEGANYREIWYYLKHAIKNACHRDALQLADCQSMLREVQKEEGVLVNPSFHFYLDDQNYVRIKELANYSLMIGERLYPSAWLEIPKPPLLVYFRGHIEWLQEPLISIVGTRAISSQGQRDASSLTQALCQAGYVCVSGMALGVDAMVHRTALSCPGGKTIAVLPAGFGTCYPRSHASLMNELGQSNLLLSEYQPHIGIKKHHFIMRNRLVAGIAPALVVVEAALRSGSLITANFALQYNREIYVCPGHLSDANSAGCNQLIEAGANAIYSLPDFLGELETLYRLQAIKN